MPWPVYTTRLMQISEVETWRHYTVKEGERLILKAIALTNTSAAKQLKAHVVLNDFYVAAFLVPDAYKSQSLDLMAVGYAGEVLRVYLEADSAFAVLTGWVMADPDGPPAAAAEQLPAPEEWPAPPATVPSSSAAA